MSSLHLHTHKQDALPHPSIQGDPPAKPVTRMTTRGTKRAAAQTFDKDLSAGAATPLKVNRRRVSIGDVSKPEESNKWKIFQNLLQNGIVLIYINMKK